MLIRNYQTSKIIMAKAKKGKHVNAEENNSDESVKLQDVKEYDLLMEKRIIRLVDEFTRLRAGRVSSDMFDNVVIEAYGSKTILTEVGQVTVKGPTKVSIAVFDPLLVQHVSKALEEYGLNLNPVVEGNMVEVVIPKPSKETREALVKNASKASEKVSFYIIYFYRKLKSFY
jgi:ribosome recycling factor